MLDVSEQRARADQQLLNAIAKRVELERKLDRQTNNPWPSLLAVVVVVIVIGLIYFFLR
jgi:hypothetical protein